MDTDFQEALKNPLQVFGTPEAVLKDESLTREQKREILESWEADAIHLQDSEAEGFAGGERSHLDSVKDALESLR